MLLRRVLRALADFARLRLAARVASSLASAPPVAALLATLGTGVVVGALTARIAPETASQVPSGVTEEHVLPPFSSIEIWDLGEQVRLNVHGDLPQRVTVTSAEGTDVRTEVRGATLVVSGSSPFPVEVSVALPELERLVLWGDTDARVRAIRGPALALTLADTAHVVAEGTVARLELVVDAHSRARLNHLAADIARVTASGASRADVAVQTRLSATAVGGAGVYYLGDPEVERVVLDRGSVTQVGSP